MFLLSLPLLLLSFVILDAVAVIFQDCGSAFTLTSVYIEGCSSWPPCFVTVGSQMSVGIQFIADSVSSELDQDVVLNINLVNLRPEVTPERCESILCPVVAHAVSSLTSVMSVPSRIALNQRGYLRWRVFDERGRQVLCYNVLVQTQSPLQKLLRQKLNYPLTPQPHPIRLASLFKRSIANTQNLTTEGETSVT